MASVHDHRVCAVSDEGFTLLELLIVIVILGVLTGLAIPAYQAAVEKARGQEALRHLAAIRESMMRYYAVNGTYVGAVSATIILLDYDAGAAAGPSGGGQVPYFGYTYSNLGQATYTITAVKASNPVDSISIDQAGNITKTGVYA